MNRHKAIILAFVVLAGGILAATGAKAQMFQNYHCADGTQFIVAFYEYDKRAFMQIDGGAIPLAKRLTLSGARYSGVAPFVSMLPSTTGNGYLMLRADGRVISAGDAPNLGDAFGEVLGRAVGIAGKLRPIA